MVVEKRSDSAFEQPVDVWGEWGTLDRRFCGSRVRPGSPCAEDHPSSDDRIVSAFDEETCSMEGGGTRDDHVV